MQNTPLRNYNSTLRNTKLTTQSTDIVDKIKNKERWSQFKERCFLFNF